MALCQEGQLISPPENKIKTRPSERARPCPGCPESVQVVSKVSGPSVQVMSRPSSVRVRQSVRASALRLVRSAARISRGRRLRKSENI